ncbi:MAG: hypothetical protein HXY44_08265 [Syntrophaceae bacterium]|nr:hypothetical protein [Syntrophaceae bacterium]
MDQLISFRIFLPFIPLFVAFNALGILPIFASLTTEMSEPEQKREVKRKRIQILFLFRFSLTINLPFCKRIFLPPPLPLRRHRQSFPSIK